MLQPVDLPDGKKGIDITFTIRPDAAWADGVPVTTADVKFTNEVGHHPHRRQQEAQVDGDRRLLGDEGVGPLLELEEEDPSGRKRYRIYGMEPTYVPEDGTDLTSVHEGYISLTPVHFDLTDVSGVEALSKFDFARLMQPAARELD